MAAPYLVMFQLPWLEIVSTYLRWLLPYQLCHSGTHKYYYCQNILHIYNLPKHSTSNWMNTRCLFNASLKAKCYLIYISSNNLLNSAVFIRLICWSQNVIKNEYLCNFTYPGLPLYLVFLDQVYGHFDCCHLVINGSLPIIKFSSERLPLSIVCGLSYSGIYFKWQQCVLYKAMNSNITAIFIAKYLKIYLTYNGNNETMFSKRIQIAETKHVS